MKLHNILQNTVIFLRYQETTPPDHHVSVNGLCVMEEFTQQEDWFCVKRDVIYEKFNLK